MSRIEQTEARQWLADHIHVFTQRADKGQNDITFALLNVFTEEEATKLVKGKLQAAFPGANLAPDDILPVRACTPNELDLHLQVHVPDAVCATLSGMRKQQQGLSA